MDAKGFKKWLLENDLDNNELFEESLRCYSINANKASFLYSYLGLLDYVANVILEYDGIPNSYSKKESVTDDRWKNRIKDLDSDDKWETAVFNFIQEKKYNIFYLKDEIIDEFNSKRNIRNTCAHNKRRLITTSTVEDLWDFIEYSCQYLVIDGTIDFFKERLINELKYLEMQDYKIKVEETYKIYSNLIFEDRKECFSWLVNLLNEKIHDYPYNNIQRNKLKRINILFDYIFENRYSEEYTWMKNKNKLIDLYLYLNIDRYDHLMSTKTDLMEFCYQDLFINSTNKVINNCYGLYKSENCDRINKFLNYIYTESFFLQWWNLLDKFISENETLFISKEIKEKLISPDNLKLIFEDIKCLYTYNNGFNISKTDTLDYLKYCDYLNKIKIILELDKEFNIDSEDIIDLKERCKKIINDKYQKDNFESLFNLFNNNQNFLS